MHRNGRSTLSMDDAVRVALNPSLYRSRTCHAAERLILRSFLRPHEVAAYALATSDTAGIGASHGHPHWPFLRSLLSRREACA